VLEARLESFASVEGLIVATRREHFLLCQAGHTAAVTADPLVLGPLHPGRRPVLREEISEIDFLDAEEVDRIRAAERG
jgi:hypothetical protein